MAAATIAVSFWYSLYKGQVYECHLHLACGCNAKQAIAQAAHQLKTQSQTNRQNPKDPDHRQTPEHASADATELTNIEQKLAHGWSLGIWGAKCGLHTILQEGDRLELYRPLRVDPKAARRLRFAQQGKAKSAGLFAARQSKQRQL